MAGDDRVGLGWSRGSVPSAQGAAGAMPWGDLQAWPLVSGTVQPGIVSPRSLCMGPVPWTRVGCLLVYLSGLPTAFAAARLLSPQPLSEAPLIELTPAWVCSSFSGTHLNTHTHMLCSLLLAALTAV